MDIRERKLRSGQRFRQGCPPPPGNGDSNPLHPSLRVWRLRIRGAHTRSAGICLAPGLGHPGIRDPQRSQECRKDVTHCKHGGSGSGDKFCPPIEGEMRMLGLPRGGEAESGTEMQAVGKVGRRAFQSRWHRTGDSFGRRCVREGRIGVVVWRGGRLGRAVIRALRGWPGRVCSLQ